jgi:peptide deformylase
MATKDSIITLPHKDLRKKSERVHVITDDIKKIIEDMQQSTLDWEDNRPHELGVALAAVQIDQLYRIVIIRNDFDNKDDRTFFTLINPEVVKLEGSIDHDHEGCLSVKDIYGSVPRHSKVRVKALDEHGRELRFKAEGFLARVLQHEIDHTNGVLFIDHIKDDDAFFKLNDNGDLEKVSHDDIQKSTILW